MRRGTATRRAVIAGLAVLAVDQPGRAAAPPAPRLRRGMNMHDLLNWPEVVRRGDEVTYAWPPFASPRFQVEDAALAALARAGFDFVRLTVDPSILIATDGERRDAVEQRVVETARRLLGAGLAVVVDLHPVGVNPRLAPDRLVAPEGAGLFDAYARAAGRLAAALTVLPHDRVALELMNEPRLERTSDVARWQPMMERLHEAARRGSPDLALVLTGAQWSSIDALVGLDPSPFRASNVLYTFHYYDPHTFTHQGVPGEGARFVKGLHWPPRPEEAGALLEAAAARIAADPALPAAAGDTARDATRKLIRDYMATPSDADLIGRRFGEVADWARRHGIPADRVMLGEFGGVWRVAKVEAVEADRLAWLRAVRSAAEARGFPWAYWAYEPPLEADVLVALGLTGEPR
ncbi:glycoside hydrolase family 5 protein [Methylobacterium sp. JK268]